MRHFSKKRIRHEDRLGSYGPRRVRGFSQTLEKFRSIALQSKLVRAIPRRSVAILALGDQGTSAYQSSLPANYRACQLQFFFFFFMQEKNLFRSTFVKLAERY